MRARSGTVSHKRHKKVKKQTKGMSKSRRTSYKLGKQAIIKSEVYAYRDRRNRKRDFRRLWITRINAAARAEGLTYSEFMYGLNKADINLNRKTLSEMAIHDPKAFKQLTELVKK